MKPLGDPKQHYWLVQGMARATGVDLVHAVGKGWLSQRDWARTVQTCRACDWANGCKDWLRGDIFVDVPPKTCRNRAQLAMLRLEQEFEG